MTGLNKAMLIDNLGMEPELKYTTHDAAVAAELGVRS